ncbi:G/U mismatch-specific uracil-DNA glycosylase [Gracilibacillus ureilyticus]|uniref:G/U mismatch-specific uracil-DNA glycosylase n=1 Tax=Gracilibacillus ureilyticus TaxID=531814 RepID=A0A1H9NB61_9BACI|nr:DNA-deoxyinosine glycosylase [Gracilibacillus ureilyticus]SER32623.1 G/U mismatch-specific uracil-DNA glycosylase [Gracilibacillus ureilyticus]
MTDQKIYSLEPIINRQSCVLILGSIPGRQSLMKQQYYGHPKNHFWPILFEIFGQEKIEDYERKIEFLHNKNIALWDMIGSCYREGSLDSKIFEAEPNPLEQLLDAYPNIKRIGCNGTKSYQTFQRHFLHLTNRFNVVKLPSTSPIPGRYNKTFEEKVQIWKEFIEGES